MDKTAEEALTFLAEHNGLLRWRCDEDGRIAWAMIRVPWSREDRIVATLPVAEDDDPVTVAVAAVEEVRAELAARDGRRLLRLA